METDEEEEAAGAAKKIERKKEDDGAEKEGNLKERNKRKRWRIETITGVLDLILYICCVMRCVCAVDRGGGIYRNPSQKENEEKKKEDKKTTRRNRRENIQDPIVVVVDHERYDGSADAWVYSCAATYY